MRLFICTLLDDENQAFYGERMASLIGRHSELLRPIPAASAHITFAFMNAIPDTGLPGVSSACAEAAANLGSFRAELGLPFVLYTGSEARLVCAPVNAGTKELSLLETRLGSALTQLLSAEQVKGTKSFHVTLARFRKHLHRNAARPVDAELRTATLQAWAREQVIDHIEIMSSELRPGGPVYTTRHVIPLLARG